MKVGVLIERWAGGGGELNRLARHQHKTMMDERRHQSKDAAPHQVCLLLTRPTGATSCCTTGRHYRANELALCAMYELATG
ncbi:hypothetical protein T01_8877 [Trichinella spiralis]|uniref:Uncharacterized protein n=1 Tax=Trichinella spiralis TaxID=6334 RepID=A0A0V1BJE5_TRISP|nr:hypothetical protein T01_8877 [Trichinella spiralis]